MLFNIKDGNNLKEKVILVGATKTVDVDTINLAVGYGLKYVAENRVQEFREKTDFIKGAKQHFIGHLQTNKVKYLVGKVELIHSVDSLHLANAIDVEAKKKNVIQDILIEVNIGGELSKSGTTPETVKEVVKEVSKLTNVRIKGLMAMLPKSQDENYLSNLCLTMRKIFDNLKKDGFDMQYLSMGMSGDYQIAVRNGSNMIRLGSILFGARNYGDKT